MSLEPAPPSESTVPDYLKVIVDEGIIEHGSIYRQRFTEIACDLVEIARQKKESDLEIVASCLRELIMHVVKNPEDNRAENTIRYNDFLGTWNGSREKKNRVGRSHPPNEDASPSQENAIRHLEGD